MNIADKMTISRMLTFLTKEEADKWRKQKKELDRSESSLRLKSEAIQRALTGLQFKRSTADTDEERTKLDAEITRMSEEGADLLKELKESADATCGLVDKLIAMYAEKEEAKRVEEEEKRSRKEEEEFVPGGWGGAEMMMRREEYRTAQLLKEKPLYLTILRALAGQGDVPNEFSKYIVKRTDKHFELEPNILRADPRVFTGTSGAALGFQHIGYSPILWPQPVLTKCGVNVIQSQNQATLSVNSSTSTPKGFQAEGTAVTKNDHTFAALNLQPRRLHSFTNVSNSFLSAGAGAEAALVNDLQNQLGADIDFQAFAQKTAVNGSQKGMAQLGASAEVVAIGTNGGDLTLAKLRELEGKVFDKNVTKDKCVFVCRNGNAVKIQTLASSANTGAGIIMKDPNDRDRWIVDGHYLYGTSVIQTDFVKGNNNSRTAMIFFDASQYYFATFGGIQIGLDSYSGMAADTMNIHVILRCDLAMARVGTVGLINDLAT